MRFRIDRIALHGLPWEEGDAARFREQVGLELSRLLEGRPLREDARVPPLSLGADAPLDGDSVARAVARHLADALGEVEP